MLKKMGLSFVEQFFFTKKIDFPKLRYNNVPYIHLAHAHKPNCGLELIPQKLNFPVNFFETFPASSLPSTVSKNTIKMIGHHARLKDARGQSCPIYACTRANHARHPSVHVTFCGSSKQFLKEILEKNLTGRKSI